MSRNNSGNIKKHNLKLHKEQEKIRIAKAERKLKLKQIVQHFSGKPKQ